MHYGEITERLAKLGSDKWAVHEQALALKDAGQDVVIASIGEPEVPASPVIVEACLAGLQDGRTGYSNGRGEAGLLSAIAERYSSRRNTSVTEQNVLCVPGTQAALFVAFGTVLNPGDEVLVGDPYYATYDGVIAAHNAELVTVPLHPKNGFRLQASDLNAAITPNSKVVLLNSPHNPTGAVLNADDIHAIGATARKHDLWIIADEVYEDLVFSGQFSSPLDFPELVERTIIVSSISKSHATPGLRSGWIVGPETFITKALSLSEMIFFGNQPFIADATEAALRHPNQTGDTMRSNYLRRAQKICHRFSSSNLVQASMPGAGMFVMLDIRATGMSGEEFAWDLLDRQRVSVLPGEAFGVQGAGFVRVALTLSDDDIDRLIDGIIQFTQALSGEQ